MSGTSAPGLEQHGHDSSSTPESRSNSDLYSEGQVGKSTKDGLVFLMMIGRGATSTVYKCLHAPTLTLVAVSGIRCLGSQLCTFTSAFISAIISSFVSSAFIPALIFALVSALTSALALNSVFSFYLHLHLPDTTPQQHTVAPPIINPKGKMHHRVRPQAPEADPLRAQGPERH